MALTQLTLWNNERHCIVLDIQKFMRCNNGVAVLWQPTIAVRRKQKLQMCNMFGGP